MKRSRFSDEQIMGILKEHQAGLSAAGRTDAFDAPLAMAFQSAYHAKRTAIPSSSAETAGNLSMTAGSCPGMMSSGRSARL